MASRALAKLKARLAASRARRHGGRALGFSVNAAKVAGLSAVVGGAAQVAGQFAGQNIGFVASKWYGEGLVLGGAAVLLSKRPQISHALAGAAGYSMALKYRLSHGGTNPSNAGEDAGLLQNPFVS